MHDVLILASTAAHGSEESAGLFQALGIDLKLLVTQAIAFLILVFILGKFVYPVLIKAVDSRRDQIEAGLKEAKEAQEALEKAEAKVADMLAEARKEADGILARTHQETSAMVAEAETKAKDRADQIVKDARAQLDTDVAKARQALKQETIKLVAQATEKIVGDKLDASKDATLITKALQDKA
ncbi:MAG TPA: F0F1 ATP synthase subunit B [Candidatus Saccharimonadales bacterium]|nr:F0F1 ATP synthase subunit B [Candidatus Saccharimonadales bacterium]